MNVVRSVGLIVVLSACQPDPGTVTRVACGFANVLVQETDLGKIATAVAGDETIGKKVCEAVLGEVADGEATPVEFEPGNLTLNLPDGQTAVVELVPVNN